MLNKYHCVDKLVWKLSAAAESAAVCAAAYDGEGPYRVLTDEIADAYGFDRLYIPLLTDMLKERLPGADIEIIDDEIMMYSGMMDEQSVKPGISQRM